MPPYGEFRIGILHGLLGYPLVSYGQQEKVTVRSFFVLSVCKWRNSIPRAYICGCQRTFSCGCVKSRANSSRRSRSPSSFAGQPWRSTAAGRSTGHYPLIWKSGSGGSLNSGKSPPRALASTKRARFLAPKPWLNRLCACCAPRKRKRQRSPVLLTNELHLFAKRGHLRQRKPAERRTSHGRTSAGSRRACASSHPRCSCGPGCEALS